MVEDLLWFAHHHLAELVKVHRPGPVLVELLDDPVQLLIREWSQQLANQASQGVAGDESLAFFVIDSRNKSIDVIVKTRGRLSLKS